MSIFRPRGGFCVQVSQHRKPPSEAVFYCLDRMDDHMMTVTNEALQAQIKGLDEKVDERHQNNSRSLEEIGRKMDTLIELNLGQKLQAQLIGQLSEKVDSHDEAFKDFYKRLNKAESTINVHGWAWKITGTLLLACLPVCGWIVVQIQEFYQNFQHDEARVATLEFLVQGRTTPVLPPAQTSSGK
ncbi:hypothetical protein [Caballeronia sp. KNU42]